MLKHVPVGYYVLPVAPSTVDLTPGLTSVKCAYTHYYKYVKHTYVNDSHTHAHTHTHTHTHTHKEHL